MNQPPLARRSARPPEPSFRSWYKRAHWSKVKAAFRSKYPERAVICQHRDANGIQCARPATDIDHIVPHRGDWFLFCGGTDYANLQGLCLKHHSEKTAREGDWR